MDGQQRKPDVEPEQPGDKADNPISDETLVALLHAGDPSALTTVVGLYSGALLRFAYYLVGSQDSAQDIVQDVFIRLWEHPEVFAASRSLRPYLYAAVRNRAINTREYELVRSRHVEAIRGAAEHDRSLSTTSSPEAGILNAATIQFAVRQLSSRRQEAVRLRMEADLTHAEIGQVLGISTAAAERLVLRALEDLRKILRVSG